MKPQFLRSGALLLGSLLSSLWVSLPATAVRLANGQVYFNHPPRLVEAATSYSGARMSGATYQFTLSLPEDAGEPLQQVVIAQRENLDTVQFDLERSRAFLGRGFRGSPAVPIVSSTQDPKTGAVTVVFDPPVMPGSTVTVALKAERNPSVGGVYLFGVTAAPAGENSYGQFLGFGRLHFYDRDNDFFFH